MPLNAGAENGIKDPAERDYEPDERFPPWRDSTLQLV